MASSNMDTVVDVLSERALSVLENSKDFLERMYAKGGIIHLANLVKVQLRQVGLRDNIVTPREFLDALDSAIRRKQLSIDPESDDTSRLVDGR